jgi:hypothetical protein
MQAWSLVGSGVLILALGLFHSVAGEKYLVRRLLRRDNLPHLFGGDTFTKRTIRYAWHLLTLMTVACAAILFYMASRKTSADAPIAWILAFTFLGCGAWGVVATRGRHLSWVVLVAAGLLAGLGAS